MRRPDGVRFWPPLAVGDGGFAPWYVLRLTGVSLKWTSTPRASKIWHRGQTASEHYLPPWQRSLPCWTNVTRWIYIR